MISRYLLIPLLVSAGCSAGEPSDPCKVLDSYPPAAGIEGSTAIVMNDSSIMGWATGYMSPVDYGADLDDQWRTPDLALGPAKGGSSDVVCLGNGGSMVLTFARPITDGPGFDLAVFENGIDDSFLELAFIEVSSDGVTFVRFPAVFLGNEPAGAFGPVDTTQVGGLAGKYRQGFGTPFDLSDLADHPEVEDGSLDLGNVGYVRVVDVVGNGTDLDCRGNPVYDPYPTQGSAGFDLDAVAVMNEVNP